MGLVGQTHVVFFVIQIVMGLFRILVSVFIGLMGRIIIVHCVDMMLLEYLY